MSLYSMLSLILSQCRDLRMGVTVILGNFTTFDYSKCKTVLNLLETIYLILRKL